ncbi:MAG: SGNH/GDSL hydrolase family protein [Pirellulaceae bacterium]
MVQTTKNATAEGIAAGRLMPLKKRMLARMLLVVGGCLAGLLMGELALRLVGYGLSTDSAFQPDPYCGVRHVPYYRGWHTKEARVWIEINGHGFRDRDRTVAKPPDTFRIAVLGDSFAEAFQVEMQTTFWAVLERELGARWPRPGQRVEVLNFGVSGFGTAQELDMLRHYVWAYHPNLILLQFLASNDVCSNSRQLEPQTGRPFYTLDGEQLVRDDAFLRDPERVRFQSSRWIQFKDRVVHASRVAALIYQFRNRQPVPVTTEGLEPGLTLQAFQEPRDPAWNRAWAVTDRLVVEIGREAKAHGAEFALLMANCGVEVDPRDAVREPLTRQLGVNDLLYPERRLAALGALHDFPVICLVEPMLRYAKEHNVYLHGFAGTRPGVGHWNETGHRLAGELAAAQLLDMLGASDADAVSSTSGDAQPE